MVMFSLPLKNVLFYSQAQKSSASCPTTALVREFLYFSRYYFKVVCCIFVVCGKELKASEKRKRELLNMQS